MLIAISTVGAKFIQADLGVRIIFDLTVKSDHT